MKGWIGLALALTVIILIGMSGPHLIRTILCCGAGGVTGATVAWLQKKLRRQP